MKRLVFVFFSTLLLAACEPEVGSPEWCDMMDEKPRGDWTFNETADYTKHCIVR